MMILTIRTDKPESEIGLYENDRKLAEKIWYAHRQLAESIHKTIQELVKSAGKDWHDIGGIICYKGPGSFTGLRIGLTVGNALAAGLDVPIVSRGGQVWVEDGRQSLASGSDEKVVLPDYGGEVFTTKPKK